MNTVDNWQTTATAHDAERATLWREVFGDNQCPIKSIIPRIANLPGKPNSRIYEMDLKAISSDQRQKLVESIAKKFGIPAGEVESGLDKHGVPILADNVTVSSSDPRVMASFL